MTRVQIDLEIQRFPWKSQEILTVVGDVEIWDSFDRNGLLLQNGLLLISCAVYGGFMASLDLISDSMHLFLAPWLVFLRR